MPLDPRKSALCILNRLDSAEKTLDILMDEFRESEGSSAKRDRALMQALVYGVLRHRLRIDGIISRFSKIALPKIEPDVLNILRIGIFQIGFMDRIPPSAAVNTAVDMAKSVSAPWTVRFVNAVLRKASTGPLPPASGLADEKSIPQWLLSRWIQRFGKNDALAVCDAVNSVPPITLRTNTLRASRSLLMTSLLEHAGKIAPTDFSPEGICLTSLREAVFNLPGFEEGFFQVQDEAAQLAGHFLSPKPGETVLDACAGLGGKTGHLAQLMNNKGILYAMDRDLQKLTTLEKEMKRLGISIVRTCPHDLSSPLPEGFSALSFDRILLDAPCSGLGVLRRNPDAKWRASKDDLNRLHENQLHLLSRIAPLVKLSGILVYVVCSTEPEENENVIDDFLKSHPGFKPAPAITTKVIPESCISENGFFRTYPHQLSMDGFFAARLQRIS